MSLTFALGAVYMTSTATEILDPVEVERALARHSVQDWGEVGPEDWIANDESVLSGHRLLSAYFDGAGQKFWIITEADRSGTTVILPEDY